MSILSILSKNSACYRAKYSFNRASEGPDMTAGFIPKHGGYRNLLSYRKALIVYDATVCFCDALWTATIARAIR